MQVITPAKNKPGGKSKRNKLHMPRILELITTVQRTPELRPDQLAKKLGVDVRTFYRDIRMLNEVGYGIDFNRTNKKYETIASDFLPPADFTPDEALALLILARHAAEGGGAVAEPAARALAKVRSSLPAALRRQIDPLERHVRISLPAADVATEQRDLERKFQKAIAEHRELFCRYDSPRSKDSEMDRSFRLQSYELLFMNRAWYVLGYHSKHRSIRMLKLSRFTEVTMRDRRFRPPTEFSIDAFFGQAWRMIRGAKRYRIKVLFDATFAKTITETRWHPTQQVTKRPDGSVELRFAVDGLDEIVWWVLSMGSHCKVLEPRELATNVAKLAEQTAKQYKRR